MSHLALPGQVNFPASIVEITADVKDQDKNSD